MNGKNGANTLSDLKSFSRKKAPALDLAVEDIIINLQDHNESNFDADGSESDSDLSGGDHH